MSSPPSLVVPLGRPDDAGELLYARFAAEVAYRQLADWLPAEPITILDLSRRTPRLLDLMVGAGHSVVHAGPRPRRLDIAPSGRAAGRLLRVRTDPRTLSWVATASVDAVVAEGAMLSGALAAELTLDDIGRVLRPGGRVLLSVDSLVAGLSQLADQGRWAELADVPAADVVLIPGPGDSVSRCFWPEELHGMLTGCGFDVEWIRPRTVLAAETVVRALTLDQAQLSSLVTTELALAVRRQGESIGSRLVASARKR